MNKTRSELCVYRRKPQKHVNPKHDPDTFDPRHGSLKLRQTLRSALLSLGRIAVKAAPTPLLSNAVLRTDSESKPRCPEQPEAYNFTKL